MAHLSKTYPIYRVNGLVLEFYVFNTSYIIEINLIIIWIIDKRNIDVNIYKIIKKNNKCFFFIIYEKITT